MFFREKQAGARSYLQIVENRREDGRTRQRVVATVGRRDETIRGHVFCSFLALVLRKELMDRLAARGDDKVEWADVIRDVDALTVTEVEHQSKRFLLRSEARGVCGRVFQAAGVALPPTVRRAGAVTSA